MSKILTVLMTTYNEAIPILSKAIESILNQTYSEFDFLIIVDNPDNKEIIQVLDIYCSKDERIKYLVNTKNLGLPISLNKGIDMIFTKYIARMDADDIALPGRLQKQIDFLENNSNVDLVGANIRYMDENGCELYDRGGIPSEHNQIKQIMKYMNVFNHPTFMGKTEVFKGYKYRNLRYSQDYDFICRIIENNGIVANITEVLILYRKAENVNISKKVQQKITLYCVQKAYRNHELMKTDIETEVNRKLNKIDSTKFTRNMDDYDNAMDLIRTGNYINALFLLIRLYLSSLYYRKEIGNLLMYGILKKIYLF